MKFKIAICDDEQNQIDYMASIVASWSAHAGHNCEIRTFASAEAFLFEYEDYPLATGDSDPYQPPG